MTDRTEWNRRYSGSELLWTAAPNRFLVSEVDFVAPGRALDLACGEGRNAVWLAERGWEVTAVDFADVAIDKAHELARRRDAEVRWVVADVLEYQPESRAFDLVLLFYLQLPAEQRRTAIRMAASAVAAGGTFLLVAHDSANLTEGYGGPQSPAVLYSAEDVIGDLAGELIFESAGRVERPVETPDGERVALDVLVRARRLT